MRRLTSARWWVLLILGALLIVGGISVLLHPDRWLDSFGFRDRSVAEGAGIGIALVGAVAWIAAEIKPYR